MKRVVLGLDIGGANLKAATRDGRAACTPFAVWKEPDRLTDALHRLIGQFPDATEIAATMTAELCDCYETKRRGVLRIVHDLQQATALPIRLWSTAGHFVAPADAVPLSVAAANWHALATYCGRYAADRRALLVDIGSTTTDIIPIDRGQVRATGRTDPERLAAGELVYTGWRRTPAMALLGEGHAAEHFATSHDAHLVLGQVPEDPADTDTADHRPATVSYARARLARMLAGDIDTIPPRQITALAERIATTQRGWIANALRRHQSPDCVILAGSGSFLLPSSFHETIDLAVLLGTRLSVVAPAYACAILATERE